MADDIYHRSESLPVSKPSLHDALVSAADRRRFTVPTNMKAKLVSKNVTINRRRTSLRLERASWEALDDICKCEKLTIHELCSLIDNARHGSSRTSAVRAFIVTYFRTLAMDRGALRGGTASAILPQLSVRR